MDADPLPPDNVVVPTLATLFEIRGTQALPARNITFQGLRFTANRPTFFEPRTNPSGGDWALERPQPPIDARSPTREPNPNEISRMGALVLEGTEGVIITESSFIRLDSNAIFLSG